MCTGCVKKRKRKLSNYKINFRFVIEHEMDENSTRKWIIWASGGKL